MTRLRRSGRLSCVTIRGGLDLSGSDGINWVIEDVRIELRGATYGIQGYRGVGGVDEFTGTRAQRPVLRHVSVVGGAATGDESCSAAVIGKDMIIARADIYGCRDGIKADSRLAVRHSWIHDMDKPEGAHSDAVQIVSGTGIVFHGNRIDAYSTYSADGSMASGSWDYASGGLQTGTVSGDIQARWTNNWFAGGRYTIRADKEEGAEGEVDYIFRGNRWRSQGTSAVLRHSNLPENQYGPLGEIGDADIDCSNVWEGTGRPVLSSCS